MPGGEKSVDCKGIVRGNVWGHVQ